MKKFNAVGLAIFLMTMLTASNVYAQEKIQLFEQFYQDGNYSIGMLNPKDESFDRYKPKAMTQPLIKHVSQIGDISLAALYLNYYRTPKAASFWDEDNEIRSAIIASAISTDVPMTKDYAYAKNSEKNSQTSNYKQKDIVYSVFADGQEYIYAFRFIRKGGDEYVLTYRAPKSQESELSPEDYFNTFKLVR